jgi:hypothetical protein
MEEGIALFHSSNRVSSILRKNHFVPVSAFLQKLSLNFSISPYNRVLKEDNENVILKTPFLIS